MLGCVEKTSMTLSKVVSFLRRMFSTSFLSPIPMPICARAAESSSDLSGSEIKRALKELGPLVPRRLRLILLVEFTIFARPSESLRDPSSMMDALWRSAKYSRILLR